MKNLEHYKALISIAEKAALVLIGILVSIIGWIVQNIDSTSYVFIFWIAWGVAIGAFANLVLAILILLKLVNRLKENGNE